MSVQAISWVLDCSEAKYADRLVLLSIANHCDKFGREAWPKQETIAAEARVSKREVIRSVQSLQALGELTVVKGSGKIGRHEYQLRKMLGDNLSPTQVTDCHLESSSQVTNATVPGDKYDNPPTPPYKEEPSINRPFALSAPSSQRESSEIKKSKATPKPKTGDPRFEDFVAAIKAGYDRRNWPFAWSDKDGKQLKSLLKYKPAYSVSEFRICLKNYFDSEGTIPGAMPYTYLAKLPNFWAGPLNQFGKLIEQRTGRKEEPLRV